MKTKFTMDPETMLLPSDWYSIVDRLPLQKETRHHTKGNPIGLESMMDQWVFYDDKTVDDTSRNYAVEALALEVIQHIDDATMIYRWGMGTSKTVDEKEFRKFDKTSVEVEGKSESVRRVASHIEKELISSQLIYKVENTGEPTSNIPMIRTSGANIICH
ncbi:MAG: hypothetical protein ABIH34_02055 [Nanoarchaeota archaeon]